MLAMMLKVPVLNDAVIPNTLNRLSISAFQEILRSVDQFERKYIRYLYGVKPLRALFEMSTGFEFLCQILTRFPKTNVHQRLNPFNFAEMSNSLLADIVEVASVYVGVGEVACLPIARSNEAPKIGPLVFVLYSDCVGYNAAFISSAFIPEIRIRGY